MIQNMRWSRLTQWALCAAAVLVVGCAPPATAPVEQPNEPAASGEAAEPSGGEPAEVTSARSVLDAFMTAFSARDVEGFEATFHFPHVRLASGTVTVLDSAGTRPDLFERFQQANPEWHHSEWISREVISNSPEKVHFNTVFARYREDGSEIARYGSIYIVERIDGRWGIRARSSFAP